MGICETAETAMRRNIKKDHPIGRNPKTGTEVQTSPRRVVVFKPSAILKRRINRPSPVTLRT
jgi:nucleoid DNA-binding protein